MLFASGTVAQPEGFEPSRPAGQQISNLPVSPAHPKLHVGFIWPVASPPTQEATWVKVRSPTSFISRSQPLLRKNRPGSTTCGRDRSSTVRIMRWRSVLCALLHLCTIKL